MTQLSVAFADTSAGQLRFSLTTAPRAPLARHDGTADGRPISLRLLGASHQVLVGDLCETVACLPDIDSALPESFRADGYRFTSRVRHADPGTMSGVVADIAEQVERTRALGRAAILGRFPGRPDAVTAIIVDDAGYRVAEPDGEPSITWRTWHTYPQTGEIVTTVSVLAHGVLARGALACGADPVVHA